MFGLGKLQEAQQKMEEIKARLDNITVTAESGSGQVSVLMTASKKVKEVHIDPALMTVDNRNRVQDMIVEAISSAAEKAEGVSKAEMEAAAREIMPGMGGLLGNFFK